MCIHQDRTPHLIIGLALIIVAVIVLDEHSKERVDRVHHTIELLWDSEKYQDMRQEIIQLTIWKALAFDVCYGEKRGFRKEWA